MSLGPRKVLICGPITADMLTGALTAALCGCCPDRCSNTEWGAWGSPGLLCSSSHHLLSPIIILKPPLPQGSGLEQSERLSRDWGVGQSIPEPSILQDMMTEHVRRSGGHQRLVRGWWWGFSGPTRIPETSEREKQTEVSPPSGNKGAVRGQKA